MEYYDHFPKIEITIEEVEYRGERVAPVLPLHHHPRSLLFSFPPPLPPPDMAMADTANHQLCLSLPSLLLYYGIPSFLASFSPPLLLLLSSLLFYHDRLRSFPSLVL